MSAVRRRPPPERKRPRQRPHAENASRWALRTAPRKRATATEERRPSVTSPRARRHNQAVVRKAVNPCCAIGLVAGIGAPERLGAGEEVDSQEDFFAARLVLLRGADRTSLWQLHPVAGARAAAGRFADAAETLRAAGSGAVSAAQWRPPPERKRPRRRAHAERASCGARRTAPRERAAATEHRRPSATPPRAWRDD